MSHHRIHQFQTLFRRQYCKTARCGCIANCGFVCALLIGAIWFQLPETAASVSRRNAAIFFCIINQSLFGAMKSILSFPEQRSMMLKERKAKLYSTLPAFISWVIVDFMHIVVWSIVFSLITYFMIGLRKDPGHFFIFFVFILLDKICHNGIRLQLHHSIPFLRLSFRNAG